jgi:hypothetical protein
VAIVLHTDWLEGWSPINGVGNSRLQSHYTNYTYAEWRWDVALCKKYTQLPNTSPEISLLHLFYFTYKHTYVQQNCAVINVLLYFVKYSFYRNMFKTKDVDLNVIHCMSICCTKSGFWEQWYSSVWDSCVAVSTSRLHWTDKIKITFAALLLVFSVKIQTSIEMKTTVLWDGAPCSLVEIYRRFKGAVHTTGPYSEPRIYSSHYWTIHWANSMEFTSLVSVMS